MIPDVARPSRRGVVALAALGTVAGCSGGGSHGSGYGHGKSLPEPGAAERAEALRDSTALLSAYDATLAAHPSLAGRLAPLRAEVARHIKAFGGTPAPAARRPGATAGRTGSASPSPAATGKPSATASPTGGPARSAAAGASAPPPHPAPTLASLAAMERSLADRRAAALLEVPGDLARLLASVAAAGAGHVVLLAAQGDAGTQ
jgi:hypothetical protein